MTPSSALFRRFLPGVSLLGRLSCRRRKRIGDDEKAQIDFDGAPDRRSGHRRDGTLHAAKANPDTSDLRWRESLSAFTAAPGGRPRADRDVGRPSSFPNPQPAPPRRHACRCIQERNGAMIGRRRAGGEEGAQNFYEQCTQRAGKAAASPARDRHEPGPFRPPSYFSGFSASARALSAEPSAAPSRDSSLPAFPASAALGATRPGWHRPRTVRLRVPHTTPRW